MEPVAYWPDRPNCHLKSHTYGLISLPVSLCYSVKKEEWYNVTRLILKNRYGGKVE